jgi:hypothetical protein
VGIPRLDCFVVGLATEGSTPPPRNDNGSPVVASGRHIAEQSNPVCGPSSAGLLRRFSPRNDDPRLSLRAERSNPGRYVLLDCFVVGLATEGSTPPPRNDRRLARNDTLTFYPLNPRNPPPLGATGGYLQKFFTFFRVFLAIFAGYRLTSFCGCGISIVDASNTGRDAVLLVVTG